MNAAAALLQRFHTRSDDEIIAEVQRAAQRLSIATRSWSTVAPPRHMIDEALATAHGLHRSLSMLAAQKTGLRKAI